MGLDMYLYKAKRIDGATMKDIENISLYLEYKNDVLKGKAEGRSPKEWNGCDVSAIDYNLVEKYKPEFITRYSLWDKEKQYGYETIVEQIGYWRKANQIHNWFVENVQDGNDNCDTYEVSKDDLETLLDLCIKVKNASKLVKGKVKNGQKYENGEWKDILEDGEYIENPSVAEELLPSCYGFFFGGTEYDQWYLEDINYTIECLTKVLN